MIKQIQIYVRILKEHNKLKAYRMAFIIDIILTGRIHKHLTSTPNGVYLKTMFDLAYLRISQNLTSLQISQALTLPQISGDLKLFQTSQT